MTSLNNPPPPGPPAPNELVVPIHYLLRHLALTPSSGEALFPSSWTALVPKAPVEIDLAAEEIANIPYQLQHNAAAIYLPQEKKWIVRGTGTKLEVETLGVIASKLHGARAIQLPNKTHKAVAGIVDINEVLNLFAAPQVSSDGKKITLRPIEHGSAHFISIVPEQLRVRPSSTGSRTVKTSEEQTLQHFQYVLKSKRVETLQSRGQLQRTKLQWAEPHNGSDVVDISRYKDYLLSLKGQFQHDTQLTQLPGNKKLQLEKRLLLLEHEIDGLLKKKINFTSVDANGSRFLDYTTILNQKENLIIGLHKKIQNLQNKQTLAKKQEILQKEEIQRLSHALKTLQNPAVTQQQISDLLILNSHSILLNKQTQNLSKRLSTTGHVLKSHMKELKLKGVKVENEEQLNSLADNGDNIDIKIDEGIVHLIETRDRIIEKPMQDQKTHQLIRQLGNQIYRIYTKYPKIKEQANPQLIQLLGREVIKTVDNDGLSKIVEIVKFVPSVVKVENVYTYNAQKQRRVEFHLRVLLRSLMEEFQKIKTKTGTTAEIDQSVIAMINEEIGTIVNVDDILKCFQVNHKIVEVQKIVQKIVERVVEVPIVVPIEKIVQKIVTNTKIEQVEKIIHVPVQVIKYIDRIVEKIVQVQKIREKIVEIPKVIQKIVQRRVQVPKIIEIQVIKERIVEVQKPVVVQKIVNHAVPQIRQVEVIRQQTVVVKEIEERIKQVEKYIEKIVERIVEKPVIVEVEKIVEKIVNTIQYKPARETFNHIEYVPQIIQRIVQKVVPIIQTVQRIKQVPKIVQKIVQTVRQVPVVKQVKVIEEKIVYQDRIKQIQKIVEKIVTLYKEVQKIVQVRIEVPVIQQKIVVVQQFVQKIVPQKYQTIKIVEIQKIVQKMVQVVRMVQVPKTIVRYINQQIPVKVIVQKIVQIPKIVERIKEVRVHVDKIIQKMVEVPKVVEIEKIVEKIVVVPRIIQKIVEVPQIIEKIVQKIIQIQKIKEVIKEVRVPIIQEKIIQIEVIKHVPVTQIKTVQLIKEKIVPLIQNVDVIQPVDCIKEKIVQNRVQVPKEIAVDKIVRNTVQVEKIVEVQKALVIPFQVPVPCEKIIQKLVLIQKEVEKIKQVPRQIQKIVEVIKEVPTVQQVVKIEQKIVTHETIKQIQKIVPYITEKVKQVEVIKEKPVVTTVNEQKIVQIPVYHDKIVQVNNQVPKIYEVQKIVQKIVEVPKFVEITAKQPVFITCNKIIDRLVDKIVHTNTVEQKIVEVPTVKQKIVKEKETIREIKQVQVNKDKIVQKETFITKTDVNNQIQTKFEQVHTMQDKLVPVCHSTERIVEVPHIMQKIVQRIILMPQVHQITRHIWDIQQMAHPGVCVDVEFATHQAQYKKLYGDLKKDMNGLVNELRVMQKSHPQLAERLKSVQAYMTNLDQVIAHPKIIQVNNQKFVDKQVPVPVLVPTSGSSNQNTQIYYLILIEKLKNQLKNAQSKASYKIADDDIRQIFFSNVGKDEDKQIKSKIANYKDSPEGSKVLGKTENNALINSVLYEKYHYLSELEKSKLQINRYKKISEERLQLLHQYKQKNDVLHQKMLSLEDRLRQLLRQQGNNKEISQQLKRLLKEVEDLDQVIYNDIKKTRVSQPVQQINKLHGGDISNKLLQTKNRQLQAQIEQLRSKLIASQTNKQSSTQTADKQRVISNLQHQISQLVQQKGQTQATLPTSLEDIDKQGFSPKKPVNTQWNPLKPPAVQPSGIKLANKNTGIDNSKQIGSNNVGDSNNFKINQVGTQGGSSVASIAVKPGFSGQLLVPVVNPTVFGSYFALPSNLQFPSLFNGVISNSSQFYPSPANSPAATKRTVFQNSVSLYVPPGTPLTKTATSYLDSALNSASINSNYSFNHFNGYLTVPIGTSEFLSATEINGTPVACPNTPYSTTSNNFNNPIFIDPTIHSTANVYNTSANTQKNNVTGNLIVPVFQPDYATTYYASVDSSGNVILPSGGVPSSPQSQIVYVPKGTNYQVYDETVDLSNWVGFLVLPVGNTDLLGVAYGTGDIDYLSLASSPTYTLNDEHGNAYNINTNTDDFKDFLAARTGSAKYYYFGSSVPVKLNNYFKNNFYTPTLAGQTNLISFPLGRQYPPPPTGNYNRGAIANNQPGNKPLYPNNGSTGPKPNTQNNNNSGNIPLNPYSPPGSQPPTQNISNPANNNPLNPSNPPGSKSNIFNPNYGVIPTNTGANNYKINQVGTQGGSSVASIAVKPGFSGQLLVPVVNPTVFGSYFALPSNLQFPSLFNGVISNSSQFYPSPANSPAATKRTVFQNSVSLYVPPGTPLTKTATSYLDSALNSASINSNYSFNHFNGYLTVPIGTSEFLSATEINGTPVACPNTPYSTTSNNFNNPIFIDPTIHSTANVYNTSANTQKNNVTGNLIVPVFQPDYATTYYASVDSSGNVILPSGGVPSSPQSQIVYVPKGTNYQVYDETVDLSNWVGFLVLPVGNTDLLGVAYGTGDIDYLSLASSPTYTLNDEHGNAYNINTNTDDFKDFLAARTGSAKYYYFGSSVPVKLNNYFKNNFYTPTLAGQTNLISFPLGRQYPPPPTGNYNRGAIANNQPGNKPLYPNNGSTGPKPNTQNNNNSGNIPLNPYSPPGSQPPTQNISNPANNNPLNPSNPPGSKSNIFNPNYGVIPTNTGANNYKINQVGTQGGSSVASIAVKPGFSGQLLVPVVNPTVFGSYFALPSNLQFPSLFNGVISNSSQFYPSPANSPAATKRTVFQNSVSLYVPPGTPLTKTATSYLDSALNSASINSNYSFNHFNGYLTVPIGTSEFLSATEINGTPVACPNTPYSTTSNNFNNPIFIDPTIHSTANVYNTSANTQKNNVTGNLIVPVFQPDYATTYYASVDSSGNVILPSGGVPSSPQSQIVYVPKGTNYQVYDETVDLSNWVGFLVLPVGNTDLLGVAYGTGDIDYLSLASSPTYTLNDEHGNAYNINTNTDDFKDFLAARTGSSKYYYFGSSVPVKLNNYFKNNFYTPTLAGQTNLISFPLGRQYPPPPTGNYNRGAIANNQPGNKPLYPNNGSTGPKPNTQNNNNSGNIPLNPYSPPGSQPPTQNISNPANNNPLNPSNPPGSKSNIFNPNYGVIPTNTGANNYKINQVGTQGGSSVASIAVKPGFSGQLLVPVVNPTVFGSYFALPSNLQFPSLFNGVISNSSQFYPSPANSPAATKRTVFQNSVSLYVPPGTPLTKTATSYLDSALNSASINSNYSFNHFNGYLTVPIGTSEFLSATEINGTPVACPNTPYSTTSNNFNNPIFIDPTIHSTANVYNTSANTQKNNVTGNLIVPVFQPDYATTYYASVDSSGNVILPSGGVSSSPQSQIVYVPKGTNYQVYDETVDLSNWVGFLVLPVGNTDLLGVAYGTGDIDYLSLASSPTYTLNDEHGNAYNISTNTDDFKDFLAARTGSSKYYYFGSSVPVKLNNYFKNNFYTPTLAGQTNLISFPLGRQYPPPPTGNYNRGAIANNQPGNKPLYPNNGSTGPKPNTQNNNNSGNIPLNPYSPPGSQPPTQNISNPASNNPLNPSNPPGSKSNIFNPNYGVIPTNTGANNYKINQVGTQGGSSVASIAVKPGFSGQLLVPVVNPTVFGSYFALPSNLQFPSLFNGVISNSSQFYPSPANSPAATKRTVFQNSVSLYVPPGTPLTKTATSYLDSALNSASINSNYSFNHFNGYLTVPIGTSEFLSATEINGTPVACPNTPYSTTSNNFNNPIFIDPTIHSTANVYNTSANTQKNNVTGNLIVPVFQPDYATTYYASVDSSGNVILPSGGVPSSPQSQIVYVPKGTNYQVYDETVDLSNWVGFLVLPVGNTDLLGVAYGTGDIDYLSLASSPTYTLNDEHGNAYNINTNTDDFKDFLAARTGSSKYYYFGSSVPVKLNNYFKNNFYTPTLAGQTNLISFPLGRQYPPPPTGNYNRGAIANNQPGNKPLYPNNGSTGPKPNTQNNNNSGNIPLNPYSPPGSQPPTQSIQSNIPVVNITRPQQPSKYPNVQPQQGPNTVIFINTPGNIQQSNVQPHNSQPVIQQDPTLYPFGHHWLPYAPHSPLEEQIRSNILTPRKYKIIGQIDQNPNSPNKSRNNSPDNRGNSPNNRGNSPMKQSTIQFTYQQPSTAYIIPGSIVGQLDSSQVRPVHTTSTITIPINQTLIPYPPDNHLYSTNILNLPGRYQKVITTDQNGKVVQTIKQVGSFVGGPGGDQGGSYESNYLYKSEVKEEGEGTHKVQKQITEIRTNQTVSWISRSRVLENEPKREESPPK